MWAIGIQMLKNMKKVNLFSFGLHVSLQMVMDIVDSIVFVLYYLLERVSGVV